MTMEFVTGNMDYIRRPFIANIKPGRRVLILSDFSHDARVWQIVQSVCAELGRSVPNSPRA
jgi:2,5-dihydroxypyridine 5,6-dioxygenase